MTRTNPDVAAHLADPQDVIYRLAILLIEAAPLARRVHCFDLPHECRALLRKLVGRRNYTDLVTVLQNMSSQQAWQAAQARYRMPSASPTAGNEKDQSSK
jgi:hypothetical protein